MVSIYKICIVNEFLTDFFYESIGDSSRKYLTLRKWYYDIHMGVTLFQIETKTFPLPYKNNLN